VEALFFLIPLALLFCALTVKAFFWAVAHRQFDNLDSAARSILFDDEPHAPKPKSAPDAAERHGD
jgi:cbb3-type cytochrome oxidase maturation protein